MMAHATISTSRPSMMMRMWCKFMWNARSIRNVYLFRYFLLMSNQHTNRHTDIRHCEQSNNRPTQMDVRLTVRPYWASKVNASRSTIIRPLMQACDESCGCMPASTLNMITSMANRHVCVVHDAVNCAVSVSVCACVNTTLEKLIKAIFGNISIGFIVFALGLPILFFISPTIIILTMLVCQGCKGIFCPSFRPPP